MHARRLIAAATALLLSACSGEREERAAAADSSGIHVDPETAAPAAAARDTASTTAMDHGRPAGTGHAAGEHAPSAGVSTEDHTAHAASPAGRGAAAEAHAGHAATETGRRTSAAAHRDHTARREDGAHAAHSAAQPRAGEHAAHAGARPRPAAGHAGHDAGAAAATTNAARVARAADRKLLELGSGLVRDPAVRRRIEQDPALSRAWADPGVRRAVTGQP